MSDPAGAAPTATAAPKQRQQDVVEPARPTQRGMTLVAFSGDMDKLMAALSIASTAAATGANVTVFCTFWGLCALRRRKRLRGKSWLERMLNMMLPASADRTALSRMNMAGFGPRFFRVIMKRKHVADVDQLVATAQSVGVRFVACKMSMDVMGIEADELCDGVEISGATACVQTMFASHTSLFV